MVDGVSYPLSAGQAVAISPWQTHFYRPVDATHPPLYIRPAWFHAASRRAQSSLRFGQVRVEVTDFLARVVYAVAQAMPDPDCEDPLIEDRICDVTQVAFDQSWQWTASGPAFTGPSMPKRDYRIRNALRLLQDRLGDALALDQVAREVGPSRPHFFKLFRAQVGVTPNIYLNALRMERAIERLAGTQNAVSTIGLDLGFSSQASFSRFFIANGVVAPSDYRRTVHVQHLS